MKRDGAQYIFDVNIVFYPEGLVQTGKILSLL